MGKDETVHRSGSGLNLGVVPSERGFVVGGLSDSNAASATPRKIEDRIVESLRQCLDGFDRLPLTGQGTDPVRDTGRVTPLTIRNTRLLGRWGKKWGKNLLRSALLRRFRCDEYASSFSASRMPSATVSALSGP